MSIASLSDFKAYMRELTGDLDDPFQMALDSATAEASNFLGFNAAIEFETGAPSDVQMACMLLGQVHAELGDPETNESRRGAAQRLLLPYRLKTCIGGI